MADVTVLDSAFLKKFIEENVEDFAATLANMLKDDAIEGDAISVISKGTRENTEIVASKPLILGTMALGKGKAADLNAVIQTSAGEVSRILDEQTALFEDLQEALWATIAELNKVQGMNLEKISLDDFMDIFEDVDGDSGGSGGDSEK
ncbi:type VII secretion system-associated protein [Streptomyces sp. ADMS]|uniref:type VII secretion system-associated protein n=1 Tax=Streptomyces sp. ADMS TaxID=3071415 RepID=UPI00296FE5E7|nr:type VII secretion system-associated protein [Streptomyces sp. ADMS]MDW4906223.1 type VII secretion system-associated protein [Streptomyces sp. ADMS]